MVIEANGGSAEQEIITLDAPNGVRYSYEDQRIEFDVDEKLEYWEHQFGSRETAQEYVQSLFEEEVAHGFLYNVPSVVDGYGQYWPLFDAAARNHR